MIKTKLPRPRRARARGGLAALVSVASLLWATSAEAAPWKPKPPGATPPTQAEIDEASARYQKGTQLYDVEGDIASALLELERAYDIAPNYAVLFNIGQVARTARDYVTSLRAFEGYLEYGGASVPADKKASVEAEIKSLKELVATVEVKTNAKEGSLSVDDGEEGRLPLGAILLNPGPHRFVLETPGGSTSKSATFVGGETKAIELMIAETKPAGPVAPASPKAVVPAEGGPSKVWVGWLVTGVVGAGAIVTGSIALAQKSDIDDTAYFGPTAPANLEEKQKTTTALAITTDVLIGAAALAGAVTLYFTIQEATASDDDKKLGVVLSPNGIGLSGSF
jgi:hypothetical protein